MTAHLSGIGLGLRRALAKELFAQPPTGLSFLEIHPENYLGAEGGKRGGVYGALLEQASARFPLLTHGLTMGFGNVDRVPKAALACLGRLVRELGVPFHSDHLCFSGVGGIFAHELLPLPRGPEAVQVAVDRLAEMQDALGIPVALEHVSFYFDPLGSEMSELEFLCTVLDKSDGRLLLDVNNVYVNACNFGFDPYAFVDALPLSRVVQLHMAGHHLRPDGLRIDTHGAPVCEPVYALYEHALRRIGRHVPVLLERDDNFPPLAELAAEVARLSEIYTRVLGPGNVPPHRGDAERTTP